MTTLTTFSKNLTSKTLLIACNDCDCVNCIANNQNITIINAYASIISFEDDSNISQIAYYIKNEEIKNIIVSGHLKCNTIGKIFTNNYENSLEKNSSRLLKLLQKSKKINNINDTELIELLKLHIASQVNCLINSPYIKALIIDYGVRISGFIIDDTDSMEIIEIKKSVSTHFPFYLN